MGEIVNLRRARKAKARAAAAESAAGRRVLFGRTRGEVLAQKAERERVERVLDGAALSSKSAPVELSPPPPTPSPQGEGA